MKLAVASGAPVPYSGPNSTSNILFMDVAVSPVSPRSWAEVRAYPLRSRFNNKQQTKYRLGLRAGSMSLTGHARCLSTERSPNLEPDPPGSSQTQRAASKPDGLLPPPAIFNG